MTLWYAGIYRLHMGMSVDIMENFNSFTIMNILHYGNNEVCVCIVKQEELYTVSV